MYRRHFFGPAPGLGHHGPLAHQFAPVASGGSDPWLNTVLGLAAVATILAFLGGTYVALKYGRRASADVTGTVQFTPAGAVVAVRPAIRNVGVFRLKPLRPDGAVIKVSEMREAPNGEVTPHKLSQLDDVFGKKFAEGGETLATSVLLPVGQPGPEVVGWMIYFNLQAKKRRFVPRDSCFWKDRYFVERSS